MYATVTAMYATVTAILIQHAFSTDQLTNIRTVSIIIDKLYTWSAQFLAISNKPLTFTCTKPTDLCLVCLAMACTISQTTFEASCVLCGDC